MLLGFYCIFTQCQTDKPVPEPTTTEHDKVNPNLTDVIDFLKQEDYTNNTSWHLFPGTDVSPGSDTLKRLGLPVHGRWVRTYVNDIAHEYLQLAVKPDIAQPLDFPAGSFIVKENYRSKPTAKTISSDESELAVITLLYKPSPSFDYCATAHLAPYNGEDCYGGDWFYGFFFSKELKGGEIPKKMKHVQDSIQANTNSFCINCHAPGFNTDYVRTLDDIRNPFAQFSTTPYCDRFDTPAPKEAKLISAEAPSNLNQFKKEIEDYIQNTTLSPDLPSDVPGDPSLVFKFINPETTQSMFDSYGWKTFVALNWPNKGLNPTTKKPQRGEANKNLPFSANSENPTVWETYKPTFEVFQPGNIEWDPVNQPWNQEAPSPVGTDCGGGDEGYDFVVTMSSKARDVANETGQAFAGSFGFLMDQDSHQVRYEVLFNRTEFEYLISNGRAATLNLTPGGPKGEVNKVNFPDTKTDEKYKEGAMEIKSAWKELCLTSDCNHQDAENLAAAKKKFFVRDALIYNAEDTTCRLAPMALVGLHIIRKTYFAPQWIWITFEHQDNVPDAGQENPQGTFYNPDLEAPDSCHLLPFLFAQSPSVKACPNVDLNRFAPGFRNQPNQLTRLVPINKEAQALNMAFQNELKKIGSPFANYVLVDVQWPLNGRQQSGKVSKFNCKDNGMGEDCFTTVPQFLRNSVIESYMSTYCDISGKAQQVSNRSCLSCHGTAGADLSYIWLDAVSQRVRIE